MTVTKTMDYFIGMDELREIIATYFKQKTGKDVALCNIGVDVEHQQYCTPKFKCVHIHTMENVPIE